MASIKQPSFLGGEISPFLWGRTDLPVFARGARTMRNFFASREGAAVSRPGSTYIATAAGQCRLIPFVVSDSVSYVLEFSSILIRFYRNGRRLEEPAGTPYSVVTPYTYPDLAGLQFAQIGDTLQLTHPSHAPRELKRLAGDTTAQADDGNENPSWTLTEVSFALPVPKWHTINTPTTWRHEFAVEGSPLVGESATRPRREWIWSVTALMQRRSDGQLIESLPVDVTRTWDGATEGSRAALADNQVVVYSDTSKILSMPPAASDPGLPAGWAASTDFALQAFVVYRGRGDLRGFVGTTKSNSFKDIGEEPDYTRQPPRGTNPFTVKAPDGATVRTEKPRAVTFFEQRRVYAGTTERPGFAWLSASSNFFDYDPSLIPLADGLVSFELASMKRETIRATLGQDRLLIGTDASIWSCQGQPGSLGLLGDSIPSLRLEVGIGINGMPFLPVDNGAVLFARSKGHGVRDLLFDSGREGLASRDLSMVSQHLFVGQVQGFTIKEILFGSIITISTPLVQRKLVDWTYAEDPWGLVWAVRADGDLLSLTYSRDGGVSAWARHDSDNGGYLSVCAVPEENEDGVYVAVQRTLPGLVSTATYIERMNSRVAAGRATDGNALDSAKLYEGAPTTVITGLSHLNGLVVYATGVGLPIYGPFTVSGGQITLDEAPPVNTESSGFFTGGTSLTSLTLYVGLTFTADLGLLDLAQGEVRLKVKNVKRVGFEVDNSRGVTVGEDFDTLKEWEPREVVDSYTGEGLRSELVEMLVASSWNQGGRAVLRQSNPYAITVLGVTREVEVGG